MDLKRNSTILKNRTLLLSFRILLGALFTVSGFQKLSSPYQNFSVVVEQYQIVKGPTADLVALTLPWAEFIGGVFFALGLWESVSLSVLWVLNVLFIGVLSSGLIRKLPLTDCGCFGAAISLPPPVILGLDVLFFGFFTFYFFTRREADVPGLDRYVRH